MTRRRARPADATKAVAYVRMSTDRQDLSPDAQRAAINRWASAQGVTVVAWRDDLGVSGGTPLEDAFLRTTSFSVWTSKSDYQKAARTALKGALPWLRDSMLPIRDPIEFRHAYARVLNAAVPEIDLLVVDEGHNLKHGFDPEGSTRNVLLAGAFGHPALASADSAPWYRPKVRRLLLLSATPFEHDYADLFRQIDLFGLGDVSLHDVHGGDPRSIRPLGDKDADAGARRALVERLLVRRVSAIDVAGTMHTRNMYRREWRAGGLATHDEPLAAADMRERLAVALVQKKVTEAIGDPKFGRHFQIGMLTSFESFLESATGRRSDGDGQDGSPTPVFHGDQTVDRREQEGIDSHSIGKIVRSYRAKFGDELPHPKVNATVEELASAFTTGEKVLVFVRRIASMDELKVRLDARYNDLLMARLRAEFATEPGLTERPELGRALDEILVRYKQIRLDTIQRRGLRSDEDDVAAAAPAPPGEVAEEVIDDVPDDDGGSIDTFFAWYFRGDGSRLPPEVGNKLTGSAFRKNRLGKPSSPYSILFEDDVVGWVLGAGSAGTRIRTSDVQAELLRLLGSEGGRGPQEIAGELRVQAWAWFHAFPDVVKKGFPALRVFEAWQAAGLAALKRVPGRIGAVASAAFHRFRERFESPIPPRVGAVDPKFPAIESGIGVVTVPTVLASRRGLAEALLPEEWPQFASAEDAGVPDDLRRAFERREARRALFSGQCRLGAPYIDLYVLAIATIGSIDAGATAAAEGQVAELARRFVDRLDAQRGRPEFNACAELASTAGLFDVIIEKNFDDIRGAGHDALPRAIQQTLAAQSPVASSGKAGLVRSVRQFRMPGFPLVLVTTDVLREGEDLHTFCRKTIHYGITWTPSGMEQRVGRIDRIGGLLQRRCSGRETPLVPDEMIQIYYPFLSDTVELLQVNAVLHRMNEFVRLMHRNVPPSKIESRSIDTARAYTEPLKDVSPILDPLVSAFGLDERRGLLEGGAIPSDRAAPDLESIAQRFSNLWLKARTALGATFEERPSSEFARHGMLVRIDAQNRRQPVSLTVQRARVGQGLSLRCTSRVGVVRAGDDEPSFNAAELRVGLVCEFTPGSVRRDRTLFVAVEIPFGELSTDSARIAELVRLVAVAADREQRLRLDEDPDSDAER